MLCQDLYATWASFPIVTHRGFVWWDFVAKNPHYGIFPTNISTQTCTNLISTGVSSILRKNPRPMFTFARKPPHTVTH